ncbi:hypothetical protein TNCV_3283911 [Trichonephila clavipes]|nr:hypothetical protein TNCV_3283911 [Trichonephila clavipes]
MQDGATLHIGRQVKTLLSANIGDNRDYPDIIRIILKVELELKLPCIERSMYFLQALIVSSTYGASSGFNERQLNAINSGMNKIWKAKLKFEKVSVLSDSPTESSEELIEVDDDNVRTVQLWQTKTVGSLFIAQKSITDADSNKKK